MLSSMKKKPDYSALGKKGGPARALSLSPFRRRQIAKKAARARWNKLSTGVA